jgi:hypothetical protein
MGKLTAVIALGAGYVLGTHAGRERYEQMKKTAVGVAQRPEVQQARDRLKTVASDKLQAGSGRVTQRTADVTDKLRRRGSSTGPVGGADTSPFPSPGTPTVDESPSGAALTQDLPGDPGDAYRAPGADPLR